MDAIGCDKARELLEQGWHDGLGEAGFRAVTAHLVDCAACTVTARSSARVDSALSALAAAYDQATPPVGIASRVCDALTQERTHPAPGRGGNDAFELRRFLEYLARKAPLREAIARAGGASARLEALVTLAHAQGFRFGEETVRRTLMARDAANDGELSEAQLEAIAGGVPAELAMLQALLGELPAGARGVHRK